MVQDDNQEDQSTGQGGQPSSSGETTPPELNDDADAPVAGRKLLMLGGAGAAIIAFVGFLLIALGGGSGDDDGDAASATATPSGLHAGLAPTRQVTPVATLDLSRPTVVPTFDASLPLPGETDGDRIVIERFDIDAPLTLKQVNSNGVMPNPNGPDDVAYYDFDRDTWPGLGGVPGWGGNIVLAGHVDSGHAFCKNGTVPPPCTAVFWDVSQLEVGDEIEIHYGGEVIVYRVTSNEAVLASGTDWTQIVAATDEETITLITCGGDFNRTTGSYDSRQVVAGVRVT